MAILVVCPGCRKRFSVGDQYAGKEGPCPKCKTVIKIPRKEDEVVVHTPEAFASGGKSVTGQLLTKPISRMTTAFRPLVAALIGLAVVGVFAATWYLGRSGLIERNWWIQLVGLLLVSPPIAIAGYAFLRDQEDLDPYHGRQLWLRAAICSLVYAGLWWGFGQAVSMYLDDQQGLWQWLIVVPFFIAGGTAAFACFDLEFGTGMLHYGFYVLLTLALRWAAGLGWIWELAERAAPVVVPGAVYR